MMATCLDKRLWSGLLVAALAAGVPEVLGQNQYSAGVLSAGRSNMGVGNRLGENSYGYSALSTGLYNSVGYALQSGIQDPMYSSRALSARARGQADTGMTDLNRPAPILRALGPRRAAASDEVLGPPPEMRDPLNPKGEEAKQGFVIAQQYLKEIGANTAAGAVSGRAVTSLVPEAPGTYRDLMDQGQQALLAGGWNDVQRAVDAFSKAQLLTDRNPDVTIALAHANFIIARFSYSLPSEYLQQTLILLPELPLVQLEPKLFFASAETYDKRMAILASYLKEHPDDPDAWLVQAYFKWFEPGGAQTAADALRQAWACSARPRTLGLGAMTMSGLPGPRTAWDTTSGKGQPDQAPESQIRVAIDIFWKGMVRSGKVSGALEQTVAPAATSRPMGASPAPGEKAGKIDKERSADVTRPR